MFSSFNIDSYDFDVLEKSAHFENVARGRKGAILVSSPNIVRSTTQYKNPPTYFLPIHYQILDNIKKNLTSFEANNAMIEIYDNNYKTMGYHSDLALDLADDSFIAIFSCYEEHNDSSNNRLLYIKDKTTGLENCIKMGNNMVIIFSTETNKKYQHKIVLEADSSPRWLGITFRLSKTVYPLNITIATDEQRAEFYKLRKRENTETNFNYPSISYTLSPSDLLTPIQL